MKIIKIISMVFILPMAGCMDQLNVENPNQPTPGSARNEQGILALAQGALYINGFQGLKFGGFFFGNVNNFHERMGDIITSPFVPVELYCPDAITLDDGSTLPSINVSGQVDYLRAINVPSSQNNPVYFEWAFMYSLNNAMNHILNNVDAIEMSDAKKETIKAWAYFWKGFGYSRIGSMYYAGIINNEPGKTNSNYVTKETIIQEAENNFVKAETLLNSLTGNEDYKQVITTLIPSVCQKGKGFPLSTEEWIRNINTLRARNILVNTAASSMTVSQWDKIVTLTTSGVKTTDNVFTMRTDPLFNLMGNNYTPVQAIGSAKDGGGGNKISERLIQDFKAGDQRFLNNFTQIPTWSSTPDRGNSINTRFLLMNKGKGMPGVVVMCNRDIGAHELYIAGSYEENILMQAEANIYTGNIDAGLALIDELRAYQGAGLAAVAGTGLTSDQAKEELRSERRVALAFRGFSFYDARRWGVLKNGRTGCVVVDFEGVVNTNATINYGYLDYWDVPIAELFYNPPTEGSAPVVNPMN